MACPNGATDLAVRIGAALTSPPVHRLAVRPALNAFLVEPSGQCIVIDGPARPDADREQPHDRCPARTEGCSTTSATAALECRLFTSQYHLSSGAVKFVAVGVGLIGFIVGSNILGALSEYRLWPWH